MIIQELIKKLKFTCLHTLYSFQVVWNPWIAKAKSMADFGDEEYKEMVCIEPAVAASGPISLQPGAAWTARSSTSVLSL